MWLGRFAVPLGFVAAVGIGIWGFGRMVSVPKLEVLGECVFAGAIGVMLFLALIDNDAFTPILDSLRR